MATLRQNLRELVEEIEQGTRIVAIRHKEAVLALVPMSDYRQLQAINRGGGKMYRIVFSNISGGEGKTMLTREMAFALHKQGYRVAVIDTDPQASLTKTLGLHDEAESLGLKSECTILKAFETEVNAELPPPQHVNGIDVWPSNDALLRLDPMLAADLSLQGNLREAIDRLEDQYDFMLIDTKPGITPLLNASVAAADFIVVPVSGDKGMENLDKLGRLIKVARGFSRDIKVALFARNCYDAKTNLSQAVSQDLAEYQSLAPISHPIRTSVTVGEASRLRIPLVDYKPTASVTQDIQQATEDLLNVIGAKA